MKEEKKRTVNYINTILFVVFIIVLSLSTYSCQTIYSILSRDKTSDVISSKTIVIDTIPLIAKDIRINCCDSAAKSQHMIDSIYLSLDTNSRKIDVFKPIAKLPKRKTITFDTTNLIPLIDYTEDRSALNKFKHALENIESSKVRIAFIGDSFIEGDIFSSDVREALQGEYGGDGVGFVPATSIASKYRPTIKHTHTNWNSYSIKSRRTDSISTKFIITSSVSTPKNSNALLQYKITDSKKHLKNVKSAKYIFTSNNDTKIEATINDKEKKTFVCRSSNTLQTIDISPDSCGYINSLTLSHDNFKKIYSYGVNFDGGNGIYIDNFSDRGSSGTVLSRLSPQHNREFNKINNYNLIVLQFGLNILSNTQSNYKYFENNMVNIVERLKEYYPDASIIIIGVSDRNIKVNGIYVPIGNMSAFIDHQKSIAKRTNSLFWDTNEAMKQEGGIKYFVEKRWASPDHTHINSMGARSIALKFVEALEYNLYQE